MEGKYSDSKKKFQVAYILIFVFSLYVVLLKSARQNNKKNYLIPFLRYGLFCLAMQANFDI
jgi:cytochrome c oxidase assembly factor CtaG